MENIKENPANVVGEQPARQRIPMSVPVPRLAVPEIPGFKLRWFYGDPGRIQRAMQGGYEFVNRDEVALNNRDLLGSDSAMSGNTDMGTRVSIISGGDVGADGQVARMYLMKIPLKFWLEDQKAKLGPGSRLDLIRKALMRGKLSQGTHLKPEDAEQVYLDEKRTKLFNATSRIEET